MKLNKYKSNHIMQKEEDLLISIMVFLLFYVNKYLGIFRDEVIAIKE